MMRTPLLALLAAALLVPGPSKSQVPPETRPGSAGRGEAPQSSRSPRGESSDGAQVFFGVLEAIKNYHLSAPNDSVLWERAIDGLISEIDDPYAQVFTAAEFSAFQEENTGNYAGIGVQISELNNSITITAVFRGTPAERGGIQVGDQIVSVDGEPAEGWGLNETSRRIRGRVGTTVVVAVHREGVPEPIPHSLRRDQVHVSAVTADVVQGEAGYVVLDRVAQGSTQELDSALTMLRDAKGIIVDLRRNPGGYLEESLAMADLFLPRGARLASHRGRSPARSGRIHEESWDARTPPRVPEKPVIVLVDRYTASAAEIVAGALQDHDRALVLGERTFGKGLVQTLMALPAGRRLRLTTGEWYTPLGRSLHRARDKDGNLLPEDADTLPVVLTPDGRTLQAGGGVFPDLVIADDTLRQAERDLLAAVARASAPLGLRIEEFAFGQAQIARSNGGGDPVLDEGAVEALATALASDGIPEEMLEDPVVRDYLLWRARIRFAERLDRPGLAAEVRAERDPVLAEALRLLEAARTQRELFAVALRRDSEEAPTTARSGPPPPSR